MSIIDMVAQAASGFLKDSEVRATVARQPWGLGRRWEDLRPFLEAAEGKRAVQLATVPPAKTQAGPGRGHIKTDETPYPEDKTFTPPAHAARLRAIAERAPEPVRDLYRDGLIGAKEAAALGPKNPTPEVAAKVTEVAIKARDVARAEKPKTGQP